VSKFCYPKYFNLYFDAAAKSVNITFKVEAEYLQDASVTSGVAETLNSYINSTDPEEAGGPSPAVEPGTGRARNPPDTDPGLPYAEDATNCYCPCCRFEQLVKAELLEGLAHPDAKPFDWSKDCFWYLDQATPSKPLPYHPKRPGEGWVLVCPGMLRKGGKGPWGEIQEGWLKSACKYWLIDNPTYSLKDGRFHIVISWEGRIWDICRKALKKVKWFTMDLEGTTKNGVPDPDSFKGSVTSAGKTTPLGKPKQDPQTPNLWDLPLPITDADTDAKCR
jgi:hypothetical protein